MAVRGAAALRRLALETMGWILVVGGVAALILPGPGLLMIFAGMAILSQQYEWAERRLEPVKTRALKAAEEGVETWPRILASTLGGLTVVGVGVVWIVSPAAPGWWPVRDSWWLFGGWGAGTTLVLSGLVALGLVVYSYRRFRST
jgi:Putative transmembrane protein (PGPGW)